MSDPEDIICALFDLASNEDFKLTIEVECLEAHVSIKGENMDILASSETDVIAALEGALEETGYM